MSLNEKPQIVTWPEMHYVYVEANGPFTQTAQKCWQELHKLVPGVLTNIQITSYASLYKVDPAKMIYRAGVRLKSAPVRLPVGLTHTLLPGGKYASFTLTGSYLQLPVACGRVDEIATTTNLPTF